MPAAIPAGVALVTSAFSANAILQTGLVLTGILASRNQAKRQRNAYNASLKDRKLTIRSSEAPRNIVYGNTIVSGPLVYWGTTGTFGEFAHFVITLAGHECESIDDILFDGESIGPLTGDGYVQSDSKYYLRSKKTHYFQTTTGASAGETFVLPHSPTRMLSLRWRTDDGLQAETELIPDVDYLLVGNTIQFATSAQHNKTIFVNYEYDAGRALVQVKEFLGADAGQRDVELENLTVGTDDPWRASDVGRGICRIRVSVEYHEHIFTSMPNISALVKGKKVYDPRIPGTAWSNNPVLCQRDYLKDTIFGFGCTDAEINDADVISGAHECDDNVTIPGGSQKRYTCDGVIYSDSSPRANMEVLLTSTVGNAVYSQGAWKLLPAAARAVVHDLDEDDLATGPIETQAAVPYRTVFNAVRGQFIDASNQYALSDFPPYPRIPGPYQAADYGEWIFEDFDYPMCQDAVRAQRMARLTLHKSRAGLIDTAYYKMSTIVFQPGDVVRVTRAWDGWITKEFVVLRRVFDPQRMAVQLTLQEESAALYDEDFNEFVTPDPAPNTALPDPNFVDPITGVTVTANLTTYEISADGTVQPYAIVEFDPVTSSDVARGGYIQLLWKRAGEPEYRRIKLQPSATNVRIEPIFEDDLLIIQVMAVNGLEVFSEPQTVVHTISDVLPVGKFIKGGNLLRGAGFAYNPTHDWPISTSYGIIISATPSELQNFDPTGGPSYFFKPSGNFPGPPSNAVLDVDALALGDTGLWCNAWSPPFMIEAGKAYLYAAKLLAGYSKVRMGVVIFDDAGTRIGGTQTVEVNGIQSTDWTDISLYQFISGVVSKQSITTALASVGKQAAQARFVVSAQLYQLAGYAGSSIVGVTKPIVAETSLGLSPTEDQINWDEGPQALTTPDSISDGMHAGSFIGEPLVNYPADIDQAGSGIYLQTISVSGARTRLNITLAFDSTLQQAAGGVYGKMLAILVASEGVQNAQGEYDVVGSWTRDVNDVWGLNTGSTRRVSTDFTINMELPPTRTRLSLTVAAINNGAPAQLLSSQMFINVIK